MFEACTHKERLLSQQYLLNAYWRRWLSFHSCKWHTHIPVIHNSDHYLSQSISTGKTRNGSAMAICRPMCWALGVKIYVARFQTPLCAQNSARHFLIQCATWVPKVTWHQLFNVSHRSIATLVSRVGITSSSVITLFL
jgi:hypothetical protein